MKQVCRSLGEAHQMFEERLRDSAVLREWWAQERPAGGAAGGGTDPVDTTARSHDA